MSESGCTELEDGQDENNSANPGHPEILKILIQTMGLRFMKQRFHKIKSVVHKLELKKAESLLYQGSKK